MNRKPYSQKFKRRAVTGATSNDGINWIDMKTNNFKTYDESDESRVAKVALLLFIIAAVAFAAGSFLTYLLMHS